MAVIDFGGVREEVVTRDEFPVSKSLQVLKDETIAVIGYGVQGPAQALNMKDNGFNVIIGQSSKFQRDWDRAVADGWVPNKTLFDVEEAARRGTIVQMLVSDAAQKTIWPAIKKCLKPAMRCISRTASRLSIKTRPGSSRRLTWMSSWSLPRDRALRCAGISCPVPASTRVSR